jgi:anti-anti-sigma regulatory factor
VHPPGPAFLLGAVTFMDSTCVGTLVAAYGTACDVGVGFSVTGANPFLTRILATSVLYQLLTGDADGLVR